MNQGFGLDPVPGFDRLTPDNAQLQLINSVKAGQSFLLNRVRTVIGRSDPPQIIVDIDLTECDPNLQNNDPPAVSRRHALIEWVNGQLQIVDLGSKNGTYVDGKKLASANADQPSDPTPLKLGSQIFIANLELKVIN